MRANRTHSHSSLFLMELILAILFFSIASGTCVQLFARAHTVSAGSVDLNRAVIYAQSAADIVRTGGSPAEVLAAPVQDENGNCSVYYARDWQPVLDATSASYEMKITFSDAGAGLREAAIVVSKLKTDGAQELYHLTAAHYAFADGQTEVRR